MVVILLLLNYGINHTTDGPFVEFDATVSGGTVSLKAKEVGAASMGNFTFKGNRINLF